ncbi:hypothetical protein KAI87_04830, partial [Myxococcota bacterium]|nr:hypothetical protein [Myxococcota bacterium]
SLNEGDTCNDDFQCDGLLICGSNPFVCRKPCFDYFIDTIDCSFGEICKASPSRDGAWVGACIPSECAIDDDCPNAGEVCIKATESAGACLIGCEVSWSGGYYDDDCGMQSNQIFYCQPLGNVKDALVCLDTSTDAGEEGDFCKAIDAPCRKGLACVEGMCRRYCDSENPVCGDVLACIGEPIDSGTIHICK